MFYGLVFRIKSCVIDLVLINKHIWDVSLLYENAWVVVLGISLLQLTNIRSNAIFQQTWSLHYLLMESFNYQDKYITAYANKVLKHSRSNGLRKSGML